MPKCNYFYKNPPPWIELPRDLMLIILQKVDKVEIVESVQNVCTTWRSVCSEPSLWRVISLNFRLFHVGADITCRKAVDLSQGELIDFSISRFGTSDLIRYISERCCDLKRLYLGSSISPQGLMSALENLPRLEELHLYYRPRLCNHFDIRAISIACPLLKSFSFTHYSDGYSRPGMNKLEIAEAMPNLCCLALVGNRLNNEGVQAILERCPNLKSLDLRLCFYVDLESEFGRMCSKRIRELRYSRAKDTPGWPGYVPAPLIWSDEEGD